MRRLIFFSLIFFCGCSSLELFTSLPENAVTKNDYRFYDANSKIRYQITNEEKNLIIRLNTVEIPTIMKILRSGLTFYFDVNGKKQTKVYFQYPIAHNGQMSVAPERPEFLKGQRPEMDIKGMLVKASKIGVFVSNDKTEEISVLSPNSEIRVNVEALNNSEITYELSIPFTKISANGTPALSNLSIGIVSEKLEMHTKTGSKHEGMQEGGSPGGMQGGTPPNGRGRQGGMQDSDRPDDEPNMASMSTSVEFWFKVDLAK
ncbi:MAG: hypothetical protein HXX18_10205 [Bacteroidetes bacterium]|nr:hypothetical protein [Bacteroidota bacterium]